MRTKLLLLFTSLFLVGCANNETTTPEETSSTAVESSVQGDDQESISVKVQLKIQDGEDMEKDLTIEEGTSALDALKEAYEVEEKDGFVTEIEGHANDDDTQTYWMYDVNGEMAEVGAQDYILKDNDTMTWTLESLE